MLELLDRFSERASKRLGMAYPELGDLVAIDGSVIGTRLPITRAYYSGSQREAKARVGFDLNRASPVSSI